MIWVLLVCKRRWRNWGRVISGAAAADDRVTTHPPPDRRSSHASKRVRYVGGDCSCWRCWCCCCRRRRPDVHADESRPETGTTKATPPLKKIQKTKKTNPQRDQKGRKTPLPRVDRLRECSIDLGQVQRLLPLLDELPCLSGGAGDLPWLLLLLLL